MTVKKKRARLHQMLGDTSAPRPILSDGRVGKRYSRALFFQYNEGECEPIYDIDEFHRVFIEKGDLTEYAAALELVGNWQEWLRIRRDWPLFPELIDEWKDEIRVKLKSEAMAELQKVMRSSESENLKVTVSKWLAEEGFNVTRGKAGRPKKDEKKRLLAEQKKLSEEEAARVEEALAMVRSNEVTTVTQ